MQKFLVSLSFRNSGLKLVKSMLLFLMRKIPFVLGKNVC